MPTAPDAPIKAPEKAALLAEEAQAAPQERRARPRGRGSLWANRSFALLWGGQTISIVGTSVTELALPWIVLQITGSALQVGIVSASFMASYIIFSLPAGAWGDRWDRRKMMLYADIGRGALLLTIPAAFALHSLHMAQVYLVNAGLGFFTVLFDVGYVSCLPSIVRREQLVDANGKQEFSRSGAEILGPPLGGILIAAFKAANALVVDGLSYFLSAITLFFIRGSFTPERQQWAERAGIWRQVGEGLRYVRRQETMLTLAILTACSNLLGNAAWVLIIFRAQKELHFTATQTGFMLAMAGAGSVLSALVAGELGKRFRLHHIMLATMSVAWAPMLLLAFTANLYLMGALLAAYGMSAVVWNVQSMALRQSIVPDHLLGRASSIIRMIAWCVIPLGTLAGGAGGQFFGAAAIFCAVGLLKLALAAGAWLSPLRRA